MSLDGPLSIVLAGSGGMGAVYLRALLDRRHEDVYRLAGVVDPYPERCPHLDELRTGGIPVFPEMADFYRRRSANLAIVSSPIHVHCAQTCLALENGSHVLCEKPVAATVGEARRMTEARDKAQRWVAVGYQWSFSQAVQNLKKDIGRGLFGRPKRLRCLYLWPRDDAYYARNDWAGKKRYPGGGWVLDGPANNAMAHDLHNMFYVLGAETDESAKPVEVEAELYRAFSIENYDTAAARGRTDTGVELRFYVSHASKRDLGPVLRYEFETGEVFAAGRGADIQAKRADGTVLNYGSPDLEPMKKLWDAVDAAKTGRPPVCGIESALSQTVFVNGMQSAMPLIAEFPRSLIRREEEAGRGRLWVEGLDDVLERGFETGELPSETGVSWGHPGTVVDLRRPPDVPGI